MSTQGPNAPTVATGTTPSGTSTVSWLNPNNCFSGDGSSATSSLSQVKFFSKNLIATGFGFSIPATATILGIQVDVKRSDGGAGGAELQDGTIQLMLSGSARGISLADGVSFWPNSLTFATYGGNSNLWGTTWTLSQINDATFGVLVSAVENGVGSAVASVDFIQITVTYSLPSVTNTSRMFQMF